MTRRLFLIPLCFGLLLSFCSRAFAMWGDAPGEKRDVLKVGKVPRSYLYYLPTGYEKMKKLPLLFALHGFGGDGEDMEKLTGFEAIAEKEKFILVYPNGVDKGWNDGRGRNGNVDDVLFISTLISTMQATYHTDSLRVYVTGMSNGGFMTMRVACEMSKQITAVAAVGATIGMSIDDLCDKPVPLSVMLVHGDKDPMVPFQGGESKSIPGSVALSHKDLVANWVDRDHCDSVPIITMIPDTAHDGTTIIKRVYKGGKNNTEVISYIVENGGHTWPGAYPFLPALIGKTSQNMKASKVIWEFFKSHTR